MQRELTLEFVRVTEAASLAAAPWMGKGKEKAADKAAVDTMRAVFETVHINGTVVIGEGKKDEAPRLYIGEEIGDGTTGPKLDIAVDPLEGTALVAEGLPNALTILAVAERNSFLQAPDTYMKKIAVGPEARGAINLEATVEDNLRSISRAKNKSIKDITVIVLDRPRNAEIIADIRQAGSRIKLISDGDVAGGIAAALDKSHVDVLMGIGGATEGVLTAAAIKCLGGEIQARLMPRNDEDRQQAKEMGIKDLDRVYSTDDLARGDDVIFSVTGVTDGDLLQGVRYSMNKAKTYSLVLRSKTGTVRYIESSHKITRKPDYFPRDIFNTEN
ncbi:MAG: class II fructose-bisphosphatase [Halanaerobiaceae bacterium]